MTFALQSNKISSICLTVRYFQIGFSTEHLEHFQNIATLNTQPSGQMWGGDEELEAEGLNCGRIPIRTLGFWVLSQEQNVLFWLLAEALSMAKGYQHFSSKLGIFLLVFTTTRGVGAQGGDPTRAMVPLTFPAVRIPWPQGCGPSPAPVSAVLCSSQPMFAALAKPSLHMTLMFLSLLLKHQKSGFKQGALSLLQRSVPGFSISGQVIPTEGHICFLLR